MSEPQILGPDAQPLAPHVRTAMKVQVARNRALRSGAAYEGASSDHPSLAKWQPGTWSGQAALSWSRTDIVDRLNDVARNDGWGAAGTSRLVDNIIGSGWTLAARPNHVSLGLSFEEADAISDQLEALWRDYAHDVDMWCDAERTKSMAGILGLSARHRYGPEGEAFSVLVWQDDAPTFSTAIQVIDPARCSNPNGRMDEEFLRDGVAIDGHGAPVGYHFRRSHPGEFFAGNTGLWQWDYVPRSTEWGRRVVVHTFDQKRAGMTRGVSDWAPVIRSIKQATDYEDFESQAAALNAVMAAFVETPFDPEEFLDAMGTDVSPGAVANLYSQMSDAQKAFYSAAPIEIPGVRVNMLQPGESAKFMKPEHPNANFEAFVNAALRKVASAVGLTYEQLTMDWSQVNYSSARAALLEIWRGFTARKGNFGAQYMGPIYRAWLEEVFDKRLVRLPSKAVSFEANPAAWCHADWIGPGRGWIDPLREAQAARERIEGGFTTMQHEASEQGRDWKMDALQRAREKRFYASIGLEAAPIGQNGGAPVAGDTDQDTEIEEAVNGRPKQGAHPLGIPTIRRRR